mmetsp:Transcript_3929/g.7683  ORF Transcript_3929/g.7683 Transcript_3929/m.7683 type:complete len:220 (-) Transcript_3929:725-1384(-)
MPPIPMAGIQRFSSTGTGCTMRGANSQSISQLYLQFLKSFVGILCKVFSTHRRDVGGIIHHVVCHEIVHEMPPIMRCRNENSVLVEGHRRGNAFTCPSHKVGLGGNLGPYVVQNILSQYVDPIKHTNVHVLRWVHPRQRLSVRLQMQGQSPPVPAPPVASQGLPLHVPRALGCVAQVPAPHAAPRGASGKVAGALRKQGVAVRRLRRRLRLVERLHHPT